LTFFRWFDSGEGGGGDVGGGEGRLASNGEQDQRLLLESVYLF